MNRRTLLLGLAVLPAAGCSQAQLDATLHKIQTISAKVAARVNATFAGIPVAAGVVERVAALNAEIQAAERLGQVVIAALRALSEALDEALLIAQFAPVPSNVVATLELANDALKAFLGKPPPGKPAPSLDDAVKAV